MLPDIHLPPQVRRIRHAGHDCLRLEVAHGSAIVALHGAHLLSWLPAGQREVFWLSPEALTEPSPIRGGIPVCWPWFGKQGMPANALQHGPARISPWQLTAVHHSSDDEISLSLAPRMPGMEGVPAGLDVSLRITLGRTLGQTLHTRNLGAGAVALTQALHNYFAVSDAAGVAIEGLAGLPWHDRLRSATNTDVQTGLFALEQACDRTYYHPSSNGDPHRPAHRYLLHDPAWRRRIVIDTRGSQSVVVWNPGDEGARKIADMPDDGWRNFFCIETANAGPDVIKLPADAEHRLVQIFCIF